MTSDSTKQTKAKIPAKKMAIKNTSVSVKEAPVKMSAKKTVTIVQETTAKSPANKAAVSAKKRSVKKAANKTAISPNEAPAEKMFMKAAIASKTSTSSIDISSEERLKMISIAAYHKAEKRGFAPGGELQDWAQAEQEIDEKLMSE